MRVIVAGSRNCQDYGTVARAIAESRFEIDTLLSGSAAGVDTLGEQYAKKHGIPVERHTPDWQKYGRSAGPIRNREMAMQADALVAIHAGGKGTENMIAEAKKRGLKIHVHSI